MKEKNMKTILGIMFFIFPTMFVSSSAWAADSGKLECMIYNREKDITAQATITYSGPFIREITKAIDLELWYKIGNITFMSADQRTFHDHAKLYFDGPNGKGATPKVIRGTVATASLPSGRFDANKWGYWKSEISCIHSVSGNPSNN